MLSQLQALVNTIQILLDTVITQTLANYKSLHSELFAVKSLFTEIGTLKDYIEYEMPQIPCYLIWKITPWFERISRMVSFMDYLLLGLIYFKSFSISSQQINLNYEAKQVTESSNAPESATISQNHA